MGRPKALMTDDDGRPWLHTAIDALRDGGCDHVVVVLGAEADRAESLVESMAVTVARAEDWTEGMSASLSTGLRALRGHLVEHPRDFGAVAITLVDLPDVDHRVVARVLDKVGTDPSVLGRAVYDGEPGHPVVIGLDHLPGILEATAGDRGARDYLRDRGLTLVECGDLASGQDVDTLPRRPEATSPG